VDDESYEYPGSYHDATILIEVEKAKYRQWLKDLNTRRYNRRKRKLIKALESDTFDMDKLGKWNQYINKRRR
jgi:hypothetical protein